MLSPMRIDVQLCLLRLLHVDVDNALIQFLYVPAVIAILVLPLSVLKVAVPERIGAGPAYPQLIVLGSLHQLYLGLARQLR